MWRYNYTDYYGVSNSNDELKHYKYLSKYKKNGKTYYIYDDTEYKLPKRLSDVSKKVGDRIYETGYVDKDGYKVKKIHGRVNEFSKSRSNLNNKRTKVDELKEAWIKKSYDVVKKHKMQVLKDVPKIAFSKGLAAISSFKYKFDTIAGNGMKKVKQKASELNKKYKIASTTHTSNTHGTSTSTRKWTTY